MCILCLKALQKYKNILIHGEPKGTKIMILGIIIVKKCPNNDNFGLSNVDCSSFLWRWNIFAASIWKVHLSLLDGGFHAPNK